MFVHDVFLSFKTFSNRFNYIRACKSIYRRAIIHCILCTSTYANAFASLQTVAYLCLADDRLQVWRCLQIIGVSAAHERFDGRLADGPAEEQFDHGALRHRTDARKYLDQLVVPGVRPGHVHVMHVPPKRFFALHRQPVHNGLRVFGTAAIFGRFYGYNNMITYMRIIY